MSLPGPRAVASPDENNVYLFKNNITNQYLLEKTEDATQRNSSCPRNQDRAQHLQVAAEPPRAPPSALTSTPPPL